VFKYSRYLSSVNQRYIMMIRRVQRVVRAEYRKSTREDVEISIFLGSDFEYRSWCCEI